jgi:DeoR/GlpR family transcriptional regulator of sugar metabolism
MNTHLPPTDKHAQRKMDVLRLLQSGMQSGMQGSRAIPLNDLAERVGVSGSTLRRDLRELQEAGVVRLVAGRVEAPVLPGAEMPFTLRMLDNRDEKQRIAKAALGLIQNGETIFLTGGTTVLDLAYLLRGQRHLTAITNSLRVANALLDQPGIELIILGGRVRSGEQTLHGLLAEWGVQQVRADKLFFGIQAVSAQHGLTHGQMVEVSTDRALADAASQVILLADHSKLGRVAAALVLPLSKVHTLITGAEISPEQLEAFRAHGAAHHVNIMIV